MLQKKIENSNYIGLYGKTAFRNYFGPQEVHLHFHFHVFSGWGTSRGLKTFPKAAFP